MLSKTVARARDGHCFSLAIVDDQPEVLDAIADALLPEGYRVSCKESAEDFISSDASSYDLILLDINMPDMDGIQCLNVMSEMSVSASIVLMSGYDKRILDTAVNYGRELGLNVVGYTEKPFRVSSLKKILSRSLPDKKRHSNDNFNISISDIRRGMDEAEFEMYYQPQICLSSGLVSGMEALIRWQHPCYGLLPPSVFLNVVERSGLSLDLFRYVVNRVLAGFRFMKHCLPEKAQIAINLPPSALTDRAFPEEIFFLATRSGCSSDRLKFELTETSLAKNLEIAYEITSRMRLKGFGISMDDYGSGYSSLSQLSKIPFNQVKIDMSLIQSALDSHSSRIIVEKTVEMTRNMGISVLAEGVQDAETYYWLKEIGCDEAQGWYIAKAMPPRDVLAWLKRPVFEANSV